MSRNVRLEEYRRRRHRTASRRRGCTRRDAQPVCPDAFLSLLPSGSPDPAEPAVALCAALPFLARRLRSYWGVAGLLYRQSGAAVDLHVVAPPPLTGAVRLLTRGWVDQVRELCPALHWTVRVASQPPRATDAYRCVFWRRP